jgi:antitoxin MazE
MKTEASIQKWGNGLALRVSGIMRDIPHFKEGMRVMVDVTEDGFVVKKLAPSKKKLPFSEKELLKDLTAYTSHADEMATLNNKETGE